MPSSSRRTTRELTGRLLSQLQTLVQLGGQGTAKPLQLGGGGTGFQINDPTQAPQPIEIAQQGDKLVIGYGANSAAQSLAPCPDAVGLADLLDRQEPGLRPGH